VQVLTQYDVEAWPEKLNELVGIARGEYVIILCDDDCLAPTYVEDTMSVALASNADIVYTDRRAFYNHQEPSEGKHFRMHGKAFDGGPGANAYVIRLSAPDFLFGSSLPMTCLIRKGWWERMGGHDCLLAHSDTEFWYRSIRDGAVTVYLPRPLFWYHYHAEQMSRSVNTLRPALEAFHRKHFLDFGAVMKDATAFSGPDDKFTVPLCPPSHRVGYVAAHFTSYTTLGHMALETRQLGDVARLAIQLKRQEAEQAVNAVVALVMHEAGVSFEDGWRLTDNLTLVREVPNTIAYMGAPPPDPSRPFPHVAEVPITGDEPDPVGESVAASPDAVVQAS
jgi:hypothetical protein